MSQYSDLIQQAFLSLRSRLTEPVDCAIILGTGLNDVIQRIAVLDEISYADIPGMAQTTTPTHQGKLILGKLANQTVAIAFGRLHLYEGHSAQQIALLVYVLQALGAKQLVVSNAAGALNSNFHPGDIMVINDHINFTGQNPIIGEDDSLGPRFVDMSRAYEPNLAATAFNIASQMNLPIHIGTYAGVLGPSLETSAERRMLKQWGADAVGMSTVTEVIAANHCGMKVLGLSAITNLALGDTNQQVDNIEEVLKYAAIADKGITEIIVETLQIDL